jgi:hypothetical protein
MMNKMQRIILVLGILAMAGYAQQNGAITGFITDTQCGARGATAQHIDCAKRKVASGKAKYAVYDEATKRLYILEPQATAEQYLGRRVKVTGTVSTSVLTRSGQSYDARARKVVSHADALDSSTAIAGVLTISSIEEALPSRK